MAANPLKPYTCVIAFDIASLIDDVNEAIEAGYQPLGTLMRIDDGVYLQPMIIKKNDNGQSNND